MAPSMTASPRAGVRPHPNATHTRATPRLITAIISLAGATAVAVFSTIGGAGSTSPASVAGQSSWLIPGLLGLAGLALLTLALAIPHPSPILPGLTLLGAAFLVGLPAAGPWRTLTPIAGGWLLAVAELAYWSVDFKVRGRDNGDVYARRAATIVALVGAGTVLAAIPEIDLGQIGVSGMELTALGLIGAGALIAVAAGLAWRLRPPRSAATGTGIPDRTR